MDKVEKVFKFYEMAVRLKQVIRTGWKYWAVEKDRLESVAEHVYGTIMLAVAIYGNFSDKLNIDIEKVALMLALHETEEILIGDLTFYDQKYDNKKEAGRDAVNEIFKNCTTKEPFIDLINEFEERQTENAKFAYMCDKMEADLQAYLYRENFNTGKIEDRIIQHEKIKDMQKKGFNRPEQYFLEDTMGLFEHNEVFSQIAHYLEGLEKNK